MICIGCRRGFHDGCRGETWCDCQHRASVPTFVGTEAANAQIAALNELTAQLQEMEATEPPPLPPEIQDAVDRAIANFDAGLGVRRERPKRHD